MGELNGRADISSWRMLLEEPVDLLHIPTWPAPAKILVDPTSFGEELRALGRPIASYLADFLQLFAAEDGQSERKKELWEPACIAAVADPGAITSEPLAVPTLDAAGAHDFAARMGSRRCLGPRRTTSTRRPHGSSSMPS